jgi:hypothetical protein
MTHFIGISGKPGSVKERYRFKILQELRYHGYTVHTTSLADALYAEVNGIIDDALSGATPQHISEKCDMPIADAEYLVSIISDQDLGEKNPAYGYSRRNVHVRKILEHVGTHVRREQDPEYWIDRMVDSVDPSADFAVFIDLRYPNEADYLSENDGMALRVDIDVESVIAEGESGGYKYTREALMSSVESALDEYEDFYWRFTSREFDRASFGREILEFFEMDAKDEVIW